MAQPLVGNVVGVQQCRPFLRRACAHQRLHLAADLGKCTALTHGGQCGQARITEQLGHIEKAGHGSFIAGVFLFHNGDPLAVGTFVIIGKRIPGRIAVGGIFLAVLTVQHGTGGAPNTAVMQGRGEHRAVSGGLTAQQCHQNTGEKRMGGGQIAKGKGRTQRKGAGRQPVLGGAAAQPEGGGIETGAVHIGTGQTKAGEVCINQAGIGFLQGLITKSHLLQRAHPHIGDKHIAPGQKPVEKGHALRGFQVDGSQLLTGVKQIEQRVVAVLCG